MRSKKLFQLCVKVLPFLSVLLTASALQGCRQATGLAGDEGRWETGQATDGEELRIDPATGVPYAPVFQFPIAGFTAADFGFGFGAVNTNYCLKSSGGVCLEYGAHLARDTQVSKTPEGTEVLAPADGIVRVTTNTKVGGYGADSASNSAYSGCVMVLEHEFLNGQAVTTLLGHLRCEPGSYDSVAHTGNPADGTVVRRGQYLAHVGRFYHGAGTDIVWSHLHWGMRRGTFIGSSGIGPYVLGYAPRSEFTTDAVTGALVHPTWLDPFVVAAAVGDPAMVAQAGVRFHPSGSLLEDQDGNSWLVTDTGTIAPLTSSVFVADRYDQEWLIRISSDEFSCYAQQSALPSMGHVTLYQRPGSSAVVMANDLTHERRDFIRWEAFLSWGFTSADLLTDASKIAALESSYAPKGNVLVRPGTLIKGDGEKEVAIVTVQQTRLPIGSADAFEALGFSWDRVITVPQIVLDTVAGPRVSVALSWDAIHACAVPLPCPDGGTCGGGGGVGPDPLDAGVADGSLVDAFADASSDVSRESSIVEQCNGLDDNGNGLIDEIFICPKDSRSGPVCITGCGTSGQRVCDGPSCTWGSCGAFPENCHNTIDDDCNGLVDCADPVCSSDSACLSSSDVGVDSFADSSDAAEASVGEAVVDAVSDATLDASLSDGGSVVSPEAGSSDGGSSDASSDAPDASTSLTQVTLSYVGPATPGFIELAGWWQPFAAAPRMWGPIAECLDTIPGDGRLDCTFSLPAGAAPFEFQVYLPDGRYWGDESVSASGGGGATIGTVILSAHASTLAYSMAPNNPLGNPYFNGHVSLVP